MFILQRQYPIRRGDRTLAPGADVPLEEIVVSGYRHSPAHAIETKRQSEQFMEALIAEDIGKLPDNNVAEALQCLTGINVGFTAGGSAGFGSKCRSTSV